jgi:hypothetical protein
VAKSKVKMTPALRRAIAKSELFYGFTPRQIRKMNLDLKTKALVSLGNCAQVDYVNDKWDGKTRRYFHEFEQPARLMFLPEPQADGSNVLIIVGKFKLLADGIVG